MNPARASSFLIALLAVVSCRGKDPVSPGQSPPAFSISRTAGDAQTGVVAATLPLRLTVRVLDTENKPLANARVTWEAGSSSGSVSPSASVTNSNGETSAQWTLGTVAGAARVTAQVGGVTPVTFSATVLPGPVDQIVSLPDILTMGVGDTLRIRSVLRDRYGNDVTGSAVTYRSSNQTVATVIAGGRISALAPGNALIIASAEALADTVPLTVTAAGASPCGSTAVTSLAVGQLFYPVAGDQSTRVCLSAPSGQSADYGLVVVSSKAAFNSTLIADLYGLGIDGPVSHNESAEQLPTVSPAGLFMDAPQIDRRAELELRLRERRELAGLTDAARAQYAETRRLAAAMEPKVVNVGDIMRLNANPYSACDNPDTRVGRVAAVGTKSIIVADTANPSGGYTDLEYRQVAATFDTLIYPLVVDAFGALTDVSNYGKIILFYTRAVNALTPSSAGYIIGGFFFARDLYPTSAASGLPGCQASNHAEMFYLLVPDPGGSINSNPRSKETVSRLNLGTVAHEFQHLINSSRRLYINTGAAPAEETWLDEGLSHLAEELLYLRLAGYTTRQNLGIQDVAGSPARSADFSAYGIQNFGRLYEFLRNPEVNSPYAPNDSLATRGATWSFLRYAASRQGVSGESQFLHSLVNSKTTGHANLAAVIPSLSEYLRDWSLSNMADDYSVGVMTVLSNQYINPAWNFRSIFPALRIGGQALGSYPLGSRMLFNNTPQRIVLPGGATSYVRFSVPAARQGVVSLSSNGAKLPPDALIGVVRLQ